MESVCHHMSAEHDSGRPVRFQNGLKNEMDKRNEFEARQPLDN